MTKAEGIFEAVFANEVIKINIQDLDKNNHDIPINKEDLGITVFKMKQLLPTSVMKEKAPEYIDLYLVIGRDESEEEIKMEDDRILDSYFHDLTRGHKIKLVEKRKTWTNDVMYYRRKFQERGQRDAKLLVLAISAVVVLVAAIGLYA